MNPGYVIKEWNETNSPLHLPYVREAYQSQVWSKVANYVRLYALLTEGGVYLDTDVEVLKPLDPLLNDHLFLGFQTTGPKECDWVNNAVFGAVSGHSFVRDCLRITERGLAEEGKFLRSPEVMTRALRRRGLRHYGRQRVGQISLYPTEFFYPYRWDEPADASRITAETFCVHHWEGTWWEGAKTR